ncbi:hypothetical protein NP233_g12731 [Leucocoprinus birnbaumii]|uniref:Integrase catalytic domain-containing protein n=1 Tax=Leucocoprinus birnbaumii TaxID=56174 RepID=A0AAD5YK63_9AGAR|nr:hypothetical protein NP233_g12731 [Leucocoprinus birnbaumii]
MDHDKVDALSKWKVPTNRDLLRGFLGLAGYLADDINGVQIPMAFEDVKQAAVDCKDHHRKPLQYGPEAPPINMVTDGCVTVIAGVISQGKDWKKAKVAAFFSAKLNSAQQNYPVHEIEMLAGVETMMRHKDILQGAKFRWYTDHKGLVSLLQQKELSGQQACWLEKLSQFDFEIIYVPGSENVLSDALSRIYLNDQPGTVRARSKYTYHDVIDNDHMHIHAVTMPLHVGLEGTSTVMAITCGQTRRRSDNNTRSVPSEERMEGGSDTAVTKTANLEDESAKKSTESREKLTICIPAQLRVDVADKNEESKKAMSTQMPIMTHKSGDSLAVNADQSNNSIVPTNNTSSSLVDLLCDAPVGIDIPSAIRNQYQQDPLFRLLINIQGSERLCVLNITINDRSIRKILISEAHSLLAHLGAKRTSDYLRDQVRWKSLVADVTSYCTNLHMSSTYHPESDGSTERANHTIVQMLRQCISPDQKNWVAKLPAIEFAINSARSEVTGFAPFFLNYGCISPPPSSPIRSNNCYYLDTLIAVPFTFVYMGYKFKPPRWKLPTGFCEGMGRFAFIHYTEPAVWTILDLLTGEVIPFSAALLRLYIILDGKIRKLQPGQVLTHTVPIGYDDFIAIFNQHDTEYQLCYREGKDSAWVISEGSQHIDKKILDLKPFSHAVPSVPNKFFKTLGMTNNNGGVAEECVEGVARTLFHKLLSESDPMTTSNNSPSLQSAGPSCPHPYHQPSPHHVKPYQKRRGFSYHHHSYGRKSFNPGAHHNQSSSTPSSSLNSPVIFPEDFTGRSSTVKLDGVQAFDTSSAQPGSPLGSLLLNDPFTFGNGGDPIIPDKDINMPSTHDSPQPVGSNPSDPTSLNLTNPIMLDDPNKPVDLEAPTTDPSPDKHNTATSN